MLRARAQRAPRAARRAKFQDKAVHRIPSEACRKVKVVLKRPVCTSHAACQQPAYGQAHADMGEVAPDTTGAGGDMAPFAYADAAGPSGGAALHDAPVAPVILQLEAGAPGANAPAADGGAGHRLDALRALAGQFSELTLEQLRTALHGIWLDHNKLVAVPKHAGGGVLGSGGWGEV